MIIDVIAKGGFPVQSVGNSPYGLPVEQGMPGLAFPVTVVPDGFGLPVLNVVPAPAPEPPNTPASFFDNKYFGPRYFGGGFY